MLKKFVLFFVFLFFGINNIFAFSGAGSGTSANPYKISNCLELNEVRNYSGFSFELINNIDCSDTFNWVNSFGTGFEPIGSSSSEFSGEFFGNGFSIDSLFINVTRDDIGLFGRVNHLDLYYFSLDNLLILGTGNNVGGVVGFSDSSTNFNDLRVSGSVLGTGNNVGGIIGGGISSNIFTSYFSGKVFGNNFVGGITGSNSGTVKDSFSIVNLSGVSNINPIGNSGLFVNNYWLNFTDTEFLDVSSGTSVDDINYFYNGGNSPMDVWNSAAWNFNSSELPELVFVKPAVVLPVDNLVGNHLNITNNILGLTITGTSNWISNGLLSLEFLKNGVKFFEVTRNLSLNILDMSNVKFSEVLNMSEHSLVVSGFDLRGDDLSNIYFKLHNSLTFLDEICVKDSVVDLVSDLTSKVSLDCSGSDEFLFSNLSLMYKNDRLSNSYVDISWENYNESILKIEGLNNSIIIQTLTSSKNKSVEIEDVLVFNLSGDGSLSNPFKIYSCDELNQVRLNLDYYFELKKNINCNGFDFSPIGNGTDKFTGGFFGNKFKIMYLTIDSSDSSIGSDYIGLFGAGDGADVSNLHLENLKIVGTNGDYVGGLFGSVSNSQINNIIVTGSVVGKNNVGGIVGFSSSTNIYTSYFSGSVSGLSGVGGIIGINGGSVQNSFSIVDLVGNSNFDVIGTGGLFLNNFWMEKSGNPSSSLAGAKIEKENSDYFNYKNAPMDVWDSNIWNWDFVGLPNFEFTDEDSDGVKDVLDKLIGEISDIETNLDDIDVDGTSDWVSNEDLILSFSEGGNKFLEVEKDLTIYPFYMEDVVIEIKDDSNDNNILLSGFDLRGNETKTIYFKFKQSSSFHDYICIKDEEINSISKVSEECDDDNEYIFENVITMSSSGKKSNEHIDISWEDYDDKLLKIEGLNNSAVVQFDKPTSSSSTSSSDSSTSSSTSSSSSSSGILPVSEPSDDIVAEVQSAALVEENKVEDVEPVLDTKITSPINEKLILEINESSTFLNESSGFECSLWKCKIPIGAVVLWLIW